MRIKNILALTLFFIVLSIIAYSEEKTTKKRDKSKPQIIPEEISIMGITLSKSLEELNIKECKYEKSSIKIYDFTQKEVCWKFPPLANDILKIKINYVEINTSKVLSFPTITHVFFDEDFNSEELLEKYPIMEITIDIDSDSGNEMYKLLKGKFGEPVSYEPSTIQNAMGAKFDKFVALWVINGNSIWLTNRYDKLNEGLLRAIYKTKVKKEIEKQKEKKTKDKERF